MNNKGFTLAELLGVIAVVGVLLVIAVPKIQKTVDDARINSIKSSALALVTSAENYFQSHKAFTDEEEELENIPCDKVGKMNKEYGTCEITFNSDGIATVSLSGKTGGKFDGITCTGTKESMTCESN